MPAATLRSDARRNIERVLDAAARVLADDPTASIEQIAAASEVHRSTLYRRFPTRNDLVRVLLERAIYEISARVDAAARRPPDEENLRRLCSDLVTVGERYAFLAAHYRIADLGPDPAGLTKVIRRHQRAGVLRGDLSAAWLTSAFTALAMAVVEEDRPPELLADTFLDGARLRRSSHG
jgi:AcrR family transcriptional regulator